MGKMVAGVVVCLYRAHMPLCFEHWPLPPSGLLSWGVLSLHRVLQPSSSPLWAKLPAGCQGLPELRHPGAVLGGGAYQSHRGLATHIPGPQPLLPPQLVACVAEAAVAAADPPACGQLCALLPDLSQAVPHAAKGALEVGTAGWCAGGIRCYPTWGSV